MVEPAPAQGSAPAFPKVLTPAVVKGLAKSELPELAAHIRRELVSAVAANGGHLGPNLGVVDLTIMLHRLLHSPEDAIVFDTGHQSYVHKMLTGRTDLSSLRSEGGITGYPSREESVHDIVENSHASGSIAWAHGIDRAARLLGNRTKPANTKLALAKTEVKTKAPAHEQPISVAVIGDGALTGGVALEGLINLAGDKNARTLIVLNDNERSYAPTVGGLSEHLKGLRNGEVSNRNNIFTQLGLNYFGPVDGHDLEALEVVLSDAISSVRGTASTSPAGPAVVHVNTVKGYGFLRAEQDVRDQMHATGPFSLGEDGGEKIEPVTSPIVLSHNWTDVFADEMLDLARRFDDLVAISAAMVDPVGLTPMQTEFPSRVLDVGIAEQVALTQAAGLAKGGARPVVALYSTFLNRALDQLLLDIALHKEPVTMVLDRAGVTGEDGPSHHGVWDIAFCARIPGLKFYAPRDAKRLAQALEKSIIDRTGPSLLRFSKGTCPKPLPAIKQIPAGDVLAGDWDKAKTLVLAPGAFAASAVAAVKQAGKNNICVLDPVQIFPINEELLAALPRFNDVLVIEDGVTEGGFGATLALRLANEYPNASTKLQVAGIGSDFLPHASRASVLKAHGLDLPGIVERISSLGV